MKRGSIGAICLLIIMFVVLLSLSSAAYSEDKITSKTVTGQATASTEAIIVVNTGPVITIHDPKEARTYRNTSILLNYSLTDPDGISLVWYNLDGANITLGNSSENYTYFNTSEGSKTLYLYANDTTPLLGNDSVSFYVNNTKLIIIYETFRGNEKGSSSDFDSYTDLELENFSNMVLENTNYGKIRWNEEVNLTEDLNPLDRITVLDYNVTISTQSIFVNLTELPNLNKSITLWFYNLTFNNPEILIDGETCPASVCSSKTYSNRTLSFSATGFFNFTLQETSTTPPDEPGGGGGAGGGGGGGSSAAGSINFSYFPTSINASLLQGRKLEFDINFESFDVRDASFNLSVNTPGVYLSQDSTNFILKQNETKKARIIFNANIAPGVYSGYLVVKAATSDNTTKTEKIPIVFVVNPGQGLFDLSLTVLPNYKRVFPGQQVNAQIDLYNLGLTNHSIDVGLLYKIQDYDGNTIIISGGSMELDKKNSEVVSLIIPPFTKPGRYIFTVTALYNQSNYFASDTFLVENYLSLIWLYILLAILILILAILYFLKERKEREGKKEEEVVPNMEEG